MKKYPDNLLPYIRYMRDPVINISSSKLYILDNYMPTYLYFRNVMFPEYTNDKFININVKNLLKAITEHLNLNDDNPIQRAITLNSLQYLSIISLSNNAIVVSIMRNNDKTPTNIIIPLENETLNAKFSDMSFNIPVIKNSTVKMSIPNFKNFVSLIEEMKAYTDVFLLSTYPSKPAFYIPIDYTNNETLLLLELSLSSNATQSDKPDYGRFSAVNISYFLFFISPLKKIMPDKLNMTLKGVMTNSYRKEREVDQLTSIITVEFSDGMKGILITTIMDSVRPKIFIQESMTRFMMPYYRGKIIYKLMQEFHPSYLPCIFHLTRNYLFSINTSKGKNNNVMHKDINKLITKYFHHVMTIENGGVQHIPDYPSYRIGKYYYTLIHNERNIQFIVESVFNTNIILMNTIRREANIPTFNRVIKPYFPYRKQYLQKLIDEHETEYYTIPVINNAIIISSKPPDPSITQIVKW